MQILILLTLTMVLGWMGRGGPAKLLNSSYLKVIKLSLIFFSFPQITYIFSDVVALQHAETQTSESWISWARDDILL